MADPVGGSGLSKLAKTVLSNTPTNNATRPIISNSSAVQMPPAQARSAIHVWDAKYREALSKIAVNPRWIKAGEDAVTALKLKARELNDVSDESDAINENFEVIASQFNILSNFMLSMDAKFEDFSNVIVDGLQDALDETTNTQTKLKKDFTTKLDVIDDRFDQFESRIDQHDRQIDEIYAEIKADSARARASDFLEENKKPSVIAPSVTPRTEVVDLSGEDKKKQSRGILDVIEDYITGKAITDVGKKAIVALGSALFSPEILALGVGALLIAWLRPNLLSDLSKDYQDFKSGKSPGNTYGRGVPPTFTRPQNAPIRPQNAAPPGSESLFGPGGLSGAIGNMLGIGGTVNGSGGRGGGYGGGGGSGDYVPPEPEKVAPKRSLLTQHADDSPIDLKNAPDWSHGGRDRMNTSIPASIRHNNPAAMNVAPWQKKYGSTGGDLLNDHTGQGNRIAFFPNAIQGAAAAFDLMHHGKSYAGNSLASFISTWSGGNSSAQYTAKIAKALNITPNTIITQKMIEDKDFATKMIYAMSQQESGKHETLSIEQYQQAHALFRQVALGEKPTNTNAAAYRVGAGLSPEANKVYDRTKGNEELIARIETAKLASGLPTRIVEQAKQVALQGPQAVRQFMASQGYYQDAAWCGRFAASVAKSVGMKLPPHADTASNWRLVGPEDPTPHPGDFAVRRGVSTGSGGSHVTIVSGYDGGKTFSNIGGNQGKFFSSGRVSDYQFFRPVSPVSADSPVAKQTEDAAKASPPITSKDSPTPPPAPAKVEPTAPAATPAPVQMPQVTVEQPKPAVTPTVKSPRAIFASHLDNMAASAASREGPKTPSRPPIIYGRGAAAVNQKQMVEPKMVEPGPKHRSSTGPTAPSPSDHGGGPQNGRGGPAKERAQQAQAAKLAGTKDFKSQFQPSSSSSNSGDSFPPGPADDGGGDYSNCLI